MFTNRLIILVTQLPPASQLELSLQVNMCRLTYGDKYKFKFGDYSLLG